MNKRTASMLVMAAGMAWVAGCAEWRDDRADSGYRTIDDDARDRRTDVRPAGTDATRPVTTEDAQRGGYATSGNPQGSTTAPVNPSGTTRTDGGMTRSDTTMVKSDGTTYTSPGTQDQRGSSPYAPENRAGTATDGRADHDTRYDRDGRAYTSGAAASSDPTHTKAETRAQHDRHDDGRTDAQARATDSSRSATSYDDRTGRSYDDRTARSTDERTRYADGREDRRDYRTSSEDPYGISPDAFGSSPYSPANRGVRVVKYDRRAIEPLQRETSWQSPGGAATASNWPDNRPGARSSDLARMDTQDQSRMNGTAGRDAAWREGNKPDAMAAQPGPNGKPAIDAALVGVSPDSRILSILHAKDAEEVEMGRLARNKGGSADVRRYGEDLEKDHSDHGRKVEAMASSRGIMLLEADQLKEMMKRDMAKKADGTAYTDRHDYNQGADDRRDAERMAKEAAAREAGEDARAGRTDTPPAGKDAAMKDEHKDHKEHAAVMAELNGLSGSEFDRKFAEVMLKGHRELIQKVEKCRQDVTPEVGQFLDETLTTLRKHEQTAQRLSSTR